MRLNWGKSLIIFFILFFIWVLFFVLFAMRQNIDLVSDDYYQKGAKYTDQININKRSALYADSIQITATGEQVRISLSGRLGSTGDSARDSTGSSTAVSATGSARDLAGSSTGGSVTGSAGDTTGGPTGGSAAVSAADSVHVHFYRASDKTMDFHISFLKSDAPIVVEKSRFVHGRYQAFVTWTSDGEKYGITKVVDIE